MDAYLYRCVVSGNCTPNDTASTATLFVKSAPVITTPPAGSENCTGDTVTLSVSAYGTTPLEYSWRKNETALGGWGSSSTLELASVTAGNAGSYDVLVRNECNMSGVESNNATVTVHPLPVIDLGADVHICNGDELVLDGGSGLAQYDWSTGESTQTITVSSADIYSVKVTDENGCSQSDTLQVMVDPNIARPDLGRDTAICLGETVTLDAGEIYDHYLWNVDSTSSSITVSESGNYSVEAWNDGNVCRVYDTIEVLVAEPFGQEEICLVTIDLETGKNMVIFEKTPEVGVVSYNIWRETDTTNQYKVIGTLGVDDLSILVDSTSNPEEQQYLYKISAVDTCGNESVLSPYHKTLFLQYVSAVGGVNLRWDKYEIEGVPVNFDSYIIYRGSDSKGLQPVKTISGSLNSWTDADPVATSYRQYYRIAGVKSDPCDPANTGSKKADVGPFSHSMSNLEDNRLQSSPNSEPADITLDPDSIAENLDAGALVGRFTTDDADSADTHSYMLVTGTGDTDNGSFTVSGDSLLAAVSFDFESKDSCSIRVRSTDSGEDSLFTEKQFTIRITDVLETGAKVMMQHEVRIYPNPFRHSVTIDFSSEEGKPYTMILRDLTGKALRLEKDIRTGRVVMERGRLAPGCYILELKGERIFRGKLVVE